MESLILLSVLAAVGLLIFLMQSFHEKRRISWEKERIRRAFGQPSQRQYEPGEAEGIPRYFEKHKDSLSLDDITWNDLDLDTVFWRMNTTESSAGQEYLYYMLRTPLLQEQELLRRERQMRFWMEQEQQRLKVQLCFQKLGRTGRYSLYDYLDFLDGLEERSVIRHILADLLLLAAVGMLFVSPRYGLLVLVGLLCWNISTYLKEKSTIEPYLISFRYVFRALALAEELCREKMEPFAGELERLAVLKKRFGAMKKSAVFVLGNMGGGSPLQVAADYLNMVLHLDLIAFHQMVKQLRAHERDIDELLGIVGRMEALIAAAGWRRGLSSWCEPQFSNDGLSVCGLYHPLLLHPVENDIFTKRGVLLTGSNASGKSTFLKAAALNAILAQTVHTCCATEYRGAFFRILTSMALRDDLENGESYYIVEIKSVRRILEAAGDGAAPVLCFVDEVLRGTNTVERIAASSQILKSLNRPGVLCFAATHDLELAALLEQSYDNYHFEEEVAEGDIRFPYRLQPGPAVTRNAIRLLSVMGYDEGIVRRAERMASRFLETGLWKMPDETRQEEKEEVCWK